LALAPRLLRTIQAQAPAQVPAQAHKAELVLWGVLDRLALAPLLSEPGCALLAVWALLGLVQEGWLRRALGTEPAAEIAPGSPAML